jgi:hypothetical protein
MLATTELYAQQMNIEVNIKETDQSHLAQNWKQWRALVNTVMNLRVLLNDANFLSSWAIIISSRQTPLHADTCYVKHQIRHINIRVFHCSMSLLSLRSTSTVKFPSLTSIHPSNRPSIYLWLYSPCGPWSPFQYLNLYTVGRTPWTGDQPVARPLTTHSTTHKHRINVRRHPCLELDSNPRFQCSSGRRWFMP